MEEAGSYSCCAVTAVTTVTTSNPLYMDNDLQLPASSRRVQEIEKDRIMSDSYMTSMVQLIFESLLGGVVGGVSPCSWAVRFIPPPFGSPEC